MTNVMSILYGYIDKAHNSQKDKLQAGRRINCGRI